MQARVTVAVLLLVALLLVVTAPAQQPRTQSKTPAASQQPADALSRPDHDDVAQLRAEVQRLKILLNQMRTNLAFVQSSQTPLKHQFELEADAWQLVVEQMDRRLQRMEDNEKQPKPQP